MNPETWKKFEQSELQHSSIHHLLAIHSLHKTHGYARAVDVSKHLHLSRSSVSITLKKLKTKGYVLEDKNKFLKLSDHAVELVNAVLSKRRLMFTLFSKVLHLPMDIAEEDACKVEHLLTQKTSAKLYAFLSFYLSEYPESVNFQKAFAEYSHDCHHNKQNCEVCETNCYFSGHEELFK